LDPFQISVVIENSDGAALDKRAEFGQRIDDAGAFLFYHLPARFPGAKLLRNVSDNFPVAPPEGVNMPLKQASSAALLAGVSHKKELLSVVGVAQDIRLLDRLLQGGESRFLFFAPHPRFHAR
jgi:hypothetical protein